MTITKALEPLVNLYNRVESYVHLEKPTQYAKNWLNHHPEALKANVLAWHVFYTGTMVAFVTFLPFSTVTNCALSLVAGVSYRIGIAGNCPFKFSIPACLGAMAFLTSKSSLLLIINGLAFKSLATYAIAILGITPLVLYALCIVIITHRDVEEYIQNLPKDPGSCCVKLSKPLERTTKT